jgi:tetratricopeptide (TPR) repeat protein
MRSLIGLAVVVFTAGVGSSQRLEARTSQESVSATLADLQGLREMLNTPKTEQLRDARILWPLMTYDSAFVTLPTAPPATSGPAVSVRRLRHRVPESANKAYQRAGKLARAHNAGGAAVELEAAIALDPEFAEAHAELGVQYAGLGRYREAEAEFQRTTELIPDDSLSYTNLAWVQLQLRDMAAVERSLRRVIQLSPANAMASMLLGLVLLGAQETYAEGTRYLEHAARTLPDAKRILNQLNGNLPVLQRPVFTREALRR